MYKRQIESAAKRISIMGICNKFAGIIAPLIFAAIILKSSDSVIFEQLNVGAFSEAEKDVVLDGLIRRVIWPYSILSIFLFAVGIFIRYSVLPEINQEEENKEVETDDGKTREVSGPYTNYTVNVTKNIKGNLVTDTAIPIQKSGGLSEDGSQYFVYEGDELPVVGNEYIFFAYAQPDGSLLISGPVSNMSVSDNTSDIAPFSDSTEYSDNVDAYNNQVDSGRTRFTSSYEAK